MFQSVDEKVSNFAIFSFQEVQGDAVLPVLPTIVKLQLGTSTTTKYSFKLTPIDFDYVLAFLLHIL
jgi:hypothetical protein